MVAPVTAFLLEQHFPPGGVALALIGLADDRAGLSAFTRLVAQLGVVGLVVLRVGGFERVPVPGPPVRPRQATPATVNSTVSTSPALPEG